LVVLWIGLGLRLPPIAVALLAIAAGAAATGALHEDGLADSVDGLGGGRGREEKLAIMRDSHIGAFGALALVVAVGIKAGSLAALIGTPSRAMLAVLVAAVISRSFALLHWRTLLPARNDGVARAAGQPDGASVGLAVLSGVLAAIAAAPAFGLGMPVALVLAAAGVIALSWLAHRQIGGHTGDTIGAAQQIGEALLFAGLAGGWTPLAG
jgi:adenosylcobinamide-GDP ribazoletransferase